jgi:hypothetical protein
MGRLWVPMADRFNAPSACRVSRDGACDERVQNCPHLHMRPHPAAGRADIALVELGRNGIVARCPGPHDLINDRPHIGGKPPRIGLPSGCAAFCNLGEVGGLPRRCPRLLAAARAALVRSEIISRSCARQRRPVCGSSVCSCAGCPPPRTRRRSPSARQ